MKEKKLIIINILTKYPARSTNKKHIIKTIANKNVT